MGPLLTDDADATLIVRDEADVSAVRQVVRERATAAGLPPERAESLVAAASEIAHNQIAHAGRGEAVVREVIRQGVKGVELVARDRGGGITDPSAALLGQPREFGTRGLGVGLAAAYRLADELDFDVRWGEGTLICVRKFATPIARSEVAILGRPCEGERVSGDDAFFARRPSGLLLAVVDGLGHGPLAQEAASKAVQVLREATADEPVALLELCQRPLQPTRGAVMAVVSLSDSGADTAEIAHAGLGNIGCQLYRERKVERLPSNPGVVGQPGPRARVRDQRVALGGGRRVLVMFTDGLSSRLDLADDPAALREPPLVIAHRLLLAHGRGHDDALVLVATG